MNEIKKQQGSDEDFNIQERLAFRITTLSTIISNGAGRTYLDKCGVTRTEWRVMLMLMSIGPCSARRICDVTKMDKGNVSRAVKRLLADGRLGEKPDPNDGRSAILRITPKGRLIYKKVKAFSDIREAALSKAFAAEERRVYCALSGKLQAVGEKLLLDLDREDGEP